MSPLLSKAKQTGTRLWGAARRSWLLLVLIAAVILFAWVPLYRILFPPLVDLPEHLLISKLLWEKLTGVSHLDLEISWFLGYRLLPVILLSTIAFSKFLGIPLLLLPRIVALSLIAVHAIVVLCLLYSRLRNKAWWGYLLATCLALPAVISMYTA